MPVRILAALFTLLPAMHGQSADLQVWEKPVSPGLTYHMEVDSETPLIVHALRFSPKTPGLKAMPELAGHTINEEGTVKGRLTPAQMANQSSAIAAINGDFFSFSQGAPIGIMVRNGELLDTPFKARATFGWGPNEAAVAMCSTTVSMTPEDGKEAKVDEVNQPVGQNQIALYTPAEGTAQLTGSHVAVMLTVTSPIWSPSSSIQATVDGVLPDATEAKVPDGKALLVGTGDKMSMMQGLRIGQKMIFQLQTLGFDWEKIENVIGGGPVLLRDSKIAIDAESEGFPASFFAKRHPRTAIGRTVAGDIWLVAIDGRQEISAGATLDETARIMLRLGCSDAMNLDGGGSTCLYLQGITVNRPSDGVERPVSNGILILGPKLRTYEGELKVIVPSKIALAGKPSVHLTLDGIVVPNADVIWGAQGTVWIDQGGTIHPLEIGKAKIKASAYGKVLSVDITVVEKTPPVRRRRQTTGGTR